MVLDRKSRGYFGIVFALGLECLLGSPAISEHLGLPDRSENVGEHVVPPSDIKREATEQRTVEASAGQVASNPTEIPGDPHDETTSAEGESDAGQRPYLILGDTWAQWAMALTGGFALLVSIWAVWLLQRTLDATRAAVREAEAATKAAQDSVIVTREIGEAQVRAYVSCTDFKITGFVTGGEMNCHVIIANTGQSPARKIKYSFAARCGQDAETVRFKSMNSTRSLDISAAGKAPATVMAAPLLSRENCMAIINRDVTLVFAGYIIYRDAFNVTRRTVFRAALDPSTRTRGEGEFVLCKRHNRTS